MKLETERLILRKIQPEDKHAIFSYRGDPEVNYFLPSAARQLSDVEKFIAVCASEFNQPETWFQFVILVKATNTVIGDIGIHFLYEGSEQCELGYTLHKAHQGKGYASEALFTIVDELFTTFNKHRITALIDPENSASIKMAQRLGMQQEAHFRENYFFKGKWVDELVFAVLQREWKTKR